MYNHVDYVSNRVLRPPAIALAQTAADIRGYNESEILVTNFVPERNNMVVGEKAPSSTSQFAQDFDVAFPDFTDRSDSQNDVETA